jgi:hypothetical protein
MKPQYFGLVLVLFVCAKSTPVRAQAFDQWVDSQVAAVLDSQTVGQNAKGADRQKQSPSADPRSTALVDQSSATDFISVATSLVSVSPVISQPNSSTGSAPASPSAAGSGTVTASLYALLAGLNKQSPTDPVFYKDHVSARRVSLTVGTAASTQAVDNTTAPATVLGAKFLLINGRELYTKNNQAVISMIQKKLSSATAASAVLKNKIKQLMFAALYPAAVGPDGTPTDIKQYGDFILNAFSDANFSVTLAALPASAKKQIQDLIENSIAPFSALRVSLQNTYDQISKGMQMSVAYTADIRKAQGDNYHRAELIFDYGLSERVNWTLNASADYADRKRIEPNSDGGRISTAFQGDLTKSNSAWGRTPIQLSFSGEADWLSKEKPQYTFQVGLDIPLVSGIDLPIVYRHANRIALINQTDSEARLGLSFDLARLVQGFK